MPLERDLTVECHSPGERLELTMCPRVKKKRQRHARLHWPRFNVSGRGRRCPPCVVQVSSIWNTLCARSGSRHKKDIDSLERVQSQALAMIKGLWA